MPPITQPEVVGWLLLFIPGFLGLVVAAYFGSAATRRSQLHWIAYALLFSLVLEIVARWTADPLFGDLFSPTQHPIRRAALLLFLGIVGGAILGGLQNWPWLSTRRYRLFGEDAEARVWTAFFRNPDAQDWVRVEMIDGRAFVAHVHLFSTDPGDPPRELVLSHLHLEKDRGWVEVPGAMYVDSGQIRSVIRVEDPNQLPQITATLWQEKTPPETGGAD